MRSSDIHFNPPDDLGCDPNDPKRRCFIDWIHNATLNGLTVEEKTQQRASTARGGENSSSAAKPTTYTYARFCFNHVLAQQAQFLAPELVKQNKLDIDVTDKELYEVRSNAGLQAGIPSSMPMTRRRIYYL